MRIRVLVLMLCVLFFAIGLQRANATHLAAVNITYVGIDTFTYVVTVRIYRDCSVLAPAQPTDFYTYSSASCGLSGTSVVDLITGDSTGNVATGNFITLPCSGVDTCNATLGLFSVEEFVYVDTLTLPDRCTDWIIGYTTGGQRNANDVILNAGERIYVEALINNVDAPANNSPDFIKPPVAIFCTNRDFFFNQGAVEPDGDSLIYSLVQAQGVGGAILPYISGYTAEYPFNAVDSPLTIEPSSGVISFTPIAPALKSVLSVLIEEYNPSGVLIGSIKNDMQVIINDNCTTDTLNMLGDSTTASGNHPAISVGCLDNSITLHFDNPIQCETISLDGSDFIITSPSGDPVAISQVVPPICTIGLIDSLVIILADSMRLNGSYFIYDTIGSDFIPMLSECGVRLNDTLEIRLRNCVRATVDLLNVTVVNNTSIDLLWSKYTENFQLASFLRYDVYRSLNPSVGYDSIASIFDINDTTFTDVGVSVEDTPYNYQIRMILDPNLMLTPVSDTIQSILLQGSENMLDTNLLDLWWSSYWGWDNPLYRIYESVGNGPWKEIGATADTTSLYNISLLANSYRLIIRSKETVSKFVTSSNWIELIIPVKGVPNIITPNGDGINDFFFVDERLLFDPIHLIIFNRWGMKVFEDTEYLNNWDGDNFVGKPLGEGTYYYMLKLNGGEDRAGFITIIR